MGDEVVIEHRFRGPPESANGGYTCGVLASRIEPAPAVEVTLRAPPPLDTPLTIETADGSAALCDGEALVAEGSAAEAPQLELPDPVTLEEAEAARSGSPLQQDHPFPMCFVCGPDGCKDGGLCLTCGPVEGRDVVAAPWQVDDSLPAPGGAVASELVWSVLDCPGGIAGMLVPEVGKSVLGRLTGRILEPIEAGATYVAVGWPIDRDGRKLSAGSAVTDRDGKALAVARATWIEIEPVPS